MIPEQIKQKVLGYKWEFWFDRPFGAFSMSLFKKGVTREYIKIIGVDAEWPAIIFQNGVWYKSNEVWDIFEKDLQKYLDKGGDVFSVVKKCEDYLDFGKNEIDRISKSNIDLKNKLIKLDDLLALVVSHIWLTHGFEYLYTKILNREVPKYMSGDVEKNIGDISFPVKKNAHYYFEKALKSDMPIKEVVEKYGWIKARGGFDPGFTEDELSLERERLLKEKDEDKTVVLPIVPDELKELVAISRELVYYRTLRTDVLYELMWYARPLMSEIAKHFGLTFEELRDYSALDLIEGRIEKYEYHKFTVISWGKNFAMLHEPVIDVQNKNKDIESFKGAIAFKGVVRGVVKVVKIAHEIDKVKDGDILVAPTTAPSFIIGMQRAGAFVTDEGGITSHAAIVSREMGKPCIIGTKIATRVLKDGDLVEVDAERGIVKILERNGKLNTDNKSRDGKN